MSDKEWLEECLAEMEQPYSHSGDQKLAADIRSEIDRLKGEVEKLTAERDIWSKRHDSTIETMTAEVMRVEAERDEFRDRLISWTEICQGYVEKIKGEPFAGHIIDCIAVMDNRLSAMEDAVREYLMQTDDIQILIDALAKLEGKE